MASKFWKIAALIILPIEGYISSPFGLRDDPITRHMKFHAGVDIASPYATAASATETGVVTFAGKKRGYGKLVIVKDKDADICRYYGHLGRIFVGEGEKIARGQVLGWSGLTGRTTGTHVHYEVRIDSVPIDPMKLGSGWKTGIPHFVSSPLDSFWSDILENFF